MELQGSVKGVLFMSFALIDTSPILLGEFNR